MAVANTVDRNAHFVFFEELFSFQSFRSPLGLTFSVIFFIGVVDLMSRIILNIII